MFGGCRWRALTHSAIHVEPIKRAVPHAVLESRRIDAEIGTEIQYFAPTSWTLPA
jgi:hypothetical protein